MVTLRRRNDLRLTGSMKCDNMGTLKQISIYFCLLAATTHSHPTDDEASRLAQIEALQKETDELYKQINDAIDNSLKTLGANNDTDSKNGLDLIKGLKKQLQLINDTDTDPNLSNVETDSDKLKVKDARRSKLRANDKGAARKFMNSWDHKDDSLFKDDLYHKKDRDKKYRMRYENRELMKIRIEQWAAKKAEEKDKIKKFREKSRLTGSETCYREGIKKIGKKGKKKKFGGRYPCCRKCCKRSYLGCL